MIKKCKQCCWEYDNPHRCSSCCQCGTMFVHTRNDKFESYLAHFIAFVEEEAKRIDEEKHGAYRRDGGRKFQSTLFLKGFLDHYNAQFIEKIHYANTAFQDFLDECKTLENRTDKTGVEAEILLQKAKDASNELQDFIKSITRKL